MARPREFDEASVLSAARDQFWAAGFAGTSMDAISAATGLGKGSLYGAFGGKRELFHRVFDAYCTAAVGSVAVGLDGDDADAFQRLTDHLLGHAASSAGTGHRACLLAKGAAELAEHDDVVATRSREAFAQMQSAYAADLERCRRHGDLAPEADVEQLAGLLVAVHRGIEALAEAGTDAATLRGVAQSALDLLPRPVPAGARRRRTAPQRT